MTSDVLVLDVIFLTVMLAVVISIVVYTELQYWLDKRRVRRGEMTKKDWFRKWHYSGNYYLGEFEDESV